ncbi:MAG: hypothetical protein PHV40_05105 [Candidatus Omnitrophica bacterium]|nr:hypothetical protein [Candidatus Omnitrophota bacterium]
MNIFVGNLSFTAREEDIYKVFAVFGAIAGIAIVMEKDGSKSRGFGFVEMPNDKEAWAAIAALDGKNILGRPANVLASVSRKSSVSQRALSRGGIPKRTGKYKQGRRSVSYFKKCKEAGVAFPPLRRKHKENPLRWRKKTRTRKEK